jgi:hypothetical protein
MTGERLSTPPHWAELLQTALTLPGHSSGTYSRFRTLSLGNQALLMLQHVFEPVHTYKGWAGLNRQVVKGSKAKVIYVPMFRKELNENGEKEERLTGFKLVPSIFGVSETDGEELPPYEPPHWSKDRAMNKLGINQIPFAHMDGNCQGFSAGKSIAISPVAVYPFKTFLHECSHVVCGHTTPDELAEYQAHRGLKEFEAEGAAYLLMNELGSTDQFNAAESRNYIQIWLRGEEPPESSIKRVFSTADKIYRAGLEEPKESEPAEEKVAVAA